LRDAIKKGIVWLRVCNGDFYLTNDLAGIERIILYNTNLTIEDKIDPANFKGTTFIVLASNKKIISMLRSLKLNVEVEEIARFGKFSGDIFMLLIHIFFTSQSRPTILGNKEVLGLVLVVKVINGFVSI